jgi:predicted TIM-barrel fold metal-dependent hydrolase
VLGDRLLFGTDRRYSDEAEFEHHCAYLESRGLEPADLQSVRGAMAAQVLRLDGERRPVV